MAKPIAEAASGFGINMAALSLYVLCIVFLAGCRQAATHQVASIAVPAAPLQVNLDSLFATFATTPFANMASLLLFLLRVLAPGHLMISTNGPRLMARSVMDRWNIGHIRIRLNINTLTLFIDANGEFLSIRYLLRDPPWCNICDI